MSDELAEQVYALQPDIARRFLERVADTSWSDVLDEVRGGRDPDDAARAVIALESTLDRPLPERTLLALVEGSANASLDDSTDDGARAWLERFTGELRAALGPAAPPARGTHDLDRRR